MTLPRVRQRFHSRRWQQALPSAPLYPVAITVCLVIFSTAIFVTSDTVAVKANAAADNRLCNIRGGHVENQLIRLFAESLLLSLSSRSLVVVITSDDHQLSPGDEIHAE